MWNYFSQDKIPDFLLLERKKPTIPSRTASKTLVCLIWEKAKLTGMQKYTEIWDQIPLSLER